MMHILHNYSLQRLNTFGFSVSASHFIQLFTDADFEHFVHSDFQQYPNLLLLGGGSNLLFTGNFEGLVVKAANASIKQIEEKSDKVLVEAGAGLVWDDFVALCAANGWYGSENLSDIPGNVGASPIQNIGAYGVEAKDCIKSVQGYHLESKECITLNKQECNFGYRDSIFKHELKETFLVKSVCFELSKVAQPNLSYGRVKEEYEKHGSAGPAALRQVIKRIRREKLPLYEQLGNAGSFFKNPVITENHYTQLKNDFPTIPSYATGEGYKIPAAWLIETCGFKGKSLGNAATHHLQPLVLINKGNASGKEILELATQIEEKIKAVFNIVLEKEVIIL